MAITYPPVLINEYLSEKVLQTIPDAYYGSALRFFPSLPTNIDSITEGFPEASNDVFAVYDRMLKLRRSAFPHIKGEQLLYYFYKTNQNPEALFETMQIVADLLDREDESAEELNAWVSSKIVDGVITIGTGSLAREFNPVYFHSLKVFQLEEARDVANFQTARSYAASKVIIDYTYHIPVDANNDPKYLVVPS